MDIIEILNNVTGILWLNIRNRYGYIVTEYVQVKLLECIGLAGICQELFSWESRKIELG